MAALENAGNEPPPTVHEGLEGVNVARTRISEVDGERGELLIGGLPIEQLAGQHSFEACSALLFDGKLPGAARLAEVQRELGQARVAAYPHVERTLVDSKLAGMDALRATLAALSQSASAWDIAATAGLVLAGLGAQTFGVAFAAPDANLEHATDILRMMKGRVAGAAESRALDAYFVSVAEHGLNASTFAVRVVASTGSDLVSAVTAGVGALKGPLHGGAPGPVLDMLDAVADASRAREWLAERLDRHERIMGMGHRVYRVRDPRAFVLERALAELERELGRNGAPVNGVSSRLALARAVEATATELLEQRYPARRLRANVEFYTAVLLEGLGIPRSLFSVVFAGARTAGWCAHYAEQRRSGRLIRPSALYVGPRPA